MATHIRMKRIGRRNRPFFRVVVMDSREKRDGAPIEELGWYDPIKKDENFSLNEERILHWLQVGAQPSDTVRNLMKESGLAFRWHLMRQGVDEETINQEVQKLALDRQERDKKKKVEAEKAEKGEVEEKEKVQVESEEEPDATAEAEAEVQAEAEPEEAKDKTEIPEEDMKEEGIEAEAGNEKAETKKKQEEPEEGEESKKETQTESKQDEDRSGENSSE